ncbi:DNA-binding transcriptional MerR regulator [Actinopolyspora lacussalsi]|nr:DNA-binding transcriptional MerR regulator [Actinopolyspora lacussalsi]
MNDSGAHRGSLNTSAVAAAAGYSPQQVRDLERLGVIPAVPRAVNGYREFSSVHLLALRTYRNLAVAIGPVEARDVLRRVPTLPTDEAVTLISSLHGKLVRAREDALEAQRALLSIRDEAVYDSETGAADTMTISELATALGVRTSTLRFWEQAGLVAPERVTSRSVRRYPLSAIREARITAALRAASYRIPDIRKTMHDIRELHEIDDPIAALRARIDVIAQRTLALLTAGTDLTEIIRNG